MTYFVSGGTYNLKLSQSIKTVGWVTWITSSMQNPLQLSLKVLLGTGDPVWTAWNDFGKEDHFRRNWEWYTVHYYRPVRSTCYFMVCVSLLLLVCICCCMSNRYLYMWLCMCVYCLCSWCLIFVWCIETLFTSGMQYLCQFTNVFVASVWKPASISCFRSTS